MVALTLPKRLLLLIILSIMPLHSFAAAFSIAPVKIHLSAKHPIAVMRIDNNSDKTLTLQTELKRWTQHNGNDILSNNNDILVVPPIFAIAPHAEQILRIALNTKPEQHNELAYRLIITQLPDKNTNNPRHGNNLTILVKMSVPIFVAPLTTPSTHAYWTYHKTHDTYTMQIHNTGTKHLFISELTLLTSKNLASQQNTFAYVLPGQQHSWQFKLAKTPTIIIAKQGSDNVKYSLNANQSYQEQ